MEKQSQSRSDCLRSDLYTIITRARTSVVLLLLLALFSFFLSSLLARWTESSKSCVSGSSSRHSGPPVSESMQCVYMYYKLYSLAISRIHITNRKERVGTYVRTRVYMLHLLAPVGASRCSICLLYTSPSPRD